MKYGRNPAMRVGRVLLACLGLGLVWGCTGTDESSGGGETDPTELNDSVWPMHPIADRFRGANALGAGDVNKDGFSDYVTNYEFDQRYVIALHPGAAGKLGESWVRVALPLELSAGKHVLSLRIREGGYAVDRLLLTPDGGYIPSGLGPPETPCIH